MAHARIVGILGIVTYWKYHMGTSYPGYAPQWLPPPYVQYGATLSRPVLNDPRRHRPSLPPHSPQGLPSLGPAFSSVPPSNFFPSVVCLSSTSYVLSLVYFVLPHYPGRQHVAKGRRKGAVLPKDPPTTSTHATPLPFRSHTTP